MSIYLFPSRLRQNLIDSYTHQTQIGMFMFDTLGIKCADTQLFRFKTLVVRKIVITR